MNLKSIALFIFLFLHISAFSQKEKFDAFFDQTDTFLKMFVNNGRVNYSGIIPNKMQLDSLVELIATANTDTKLPKEYNKAFLINTYNILVIKGIIENYPVNSPTEIAGFFKNIKYKIGSYGKMTLNDLENKLIRKLYQDPRTHFVLVCAGLGCPPLIDKVYLPSTLENQLESQTKLALNNPTFIRVNKENEKVEISQIFNWYKKDFISKKTKSILDFINFYRTEKIPENYKKTFYTYDWSLNNKLEVNTSLNPNPKSNILEYSPSKLMPKGQWDLRMFNNLYTQTRSANADGEISIGNPRGTFFTSSFEFITGISKNARFNAGIIFNVKSNRGNNEKTFNVFKFKTEEVSGIGISRAGLSSVGFSLKVSPFKKINNFSFQTTLFLPIFKDKSSSFYLDKRSYVWETKFFYDYSFGQDKFQAFAEIDIAYNFGELSENASANENLGERFANNSFGIPISLFLSYFPSNKFTIYASTQRYQLFSTRENGFAQDFISAGIGTKYQLTDNLNIELSSTRFLIGKNSGLGETYNIGLRYIL